MFSKTTAVSAENVPREERRRSKIQVLSLKVAVELVKADTKFSKKKLVQSKEWGSPLMLPWFGGF